MVYLVVGKFTTAVQARPGERLEVWGPLGNGFTPRPAEHLVMVAGGIGQTPFVALRRACWAAPLRQPATVRCRRQKVTLCYGARAPNYLAGVTDFAAWACDVLISTDDGSAGHHGLVTDLLAQVIGGSRPAVRGSFAAGRNR